MNRAISVFVGLVLALAVGGQVYVAKQKMTNLPVEEVATKSQMDNFNASNQNVWKGEQEDGEEDDGEGSTTIKTPTSAPIVMPGPTMSQGITLVQVAMHNSRSSCWSAINGNVYDLTSWIPNHPGGEQAILYLCGINGSEAFNNQHGGSSKIAGILAGFKIGALR